MTKRFSGYSLTNVGRIINNISRLKAFSPSLVTDTWNAGHMIAKDRFLSTIDVG